MNFKKLGLYFLLICIFACSINLAFSESLDDDMSSIGNESFNVLNNFKLNDTPTEDKWFDYNEWEGQVYKEGFYVEGDLIPYDPYMTGTIKEDVTEKEAEEYLSQYLPQNYEVSIVKFNGKPTNIYYYKTDIYVESVGDYYVRGYMYVDGNIYWYVGGASFNPYLELSN